MDKPTLMHLLERIRYRWLILPMGLFLLIAVGGSLALPIVVHQFSQQPPSFNNNILILFGIFLSFLVYFSNLSFTALLIFLLAKILSSIHKK